MPWHNPTSWFIDQENLEVGNKAFQLVLLSVFLAIPCWAAEWTFDGPTNDTRCQITPGDFGVGWIPFTLQTNGVWDLGRNGTVRLTVEVERASDTFTLTTVEWQDGAIYSEFCAINAPGEKIQDAVTLQMPLLHFGAWKHHATVWRLDSPTNVFSATLTSPFTGGVIDSAAIIPGMIAPPTVVTLWIEQSDDIGCPWRVIYQQSITNKADIGLFRLKITQ